MRESIEFNLFHSEFFKFRGKRSKEICEDLSSERAKKSRLFERVLRFVRIINISFHIILHHSIRRSFYIDFLHITKFRLNIKKLIPYFGLRVRKPESHNYEEEKNVTHDTWRAPYFIYHIVLIHHPLFLTNQNFLFSLTLLSFFLLHQLSHHIHFLKLFIFPQTSNFILLLMINFCYHINILIFLIFFVFYLYFISVT